jgi:hypothetical protein
MKNKLMIAVVTLALTLLAAGCLVGEVTHTLYLDPDGTITWSVLERDIRSDCADRAERRQEEESYISAAWSGSHPVGNALAALGPIDLETRVARGRRPFTVISEARFSSLEDLAWEILERLGARGNTWIETDGDVVRFVLLLDAEQEDEMGEDADVLDPLVADLEDYRLMLTAGHFVEAQGFELQSEDTVAVPLEVDEEKLEEEGVAVFSLTWTAGDDG